VVGLVPLKTILRDAIFVREFGCVKYETVTLPAKEDSSLSHGGKLSKALKNNLESSSLKTQPYPSSRILVATRELSPQGVANLSHLMLPQQAKRVLSLIYMVYIFYCLQDGYNQSMVFTR
jgi:hypothetical protein